MQIYADRVVGVDPQTGDGRGVNFQVQRDGQRIELNVVFLGRGSVSGRIVDEQGQPLPRTSLRLTSRTDNSQYGATADETGAFAVSGVPVGNLIIEAVYIERDRTGTQVAFAETTVAEYLPVAGASIVRTITLVRNTSRPNVTYGVLRGTVRRGDGVTPVVDVPVVAYYRNASQPDLHCPDAGANPELECAVATTRTTGDGSFVFDRIPAGSFRLETFDQVTIQQGEARVIVPAGGTGAATVLLGLGLGTVRGIVLDPGGRPVQGARVGGGLSLSVTDADGRFTLGDVPVGRREIVAVDDATNTRAVGYADIVRAGDDVNVTIVLPDVASIAGTVRQFDGAPVRGVTVHLIDCTPQCIGEGGSVRVRSETVTDASGQYRFAALTLGRYRVSAFTGGQGDGNVADAALKFGGQTVRADVTFRGGPTGRVRGRILRALENGGGDTPLHAAIGVSHDVPLVAGGRVVVGFKHVENRSITESDLTTGDFALTGIWPGGFTLNALSAFSPEPIAVQGRVETPGQVVDVTLRLQATSRMSGRVVLPDGVTAVGAGVEVKLRATPADVICGETPNGDAACSTVERPGVTEIPAVTDASGRFEFVNVPARRFTLRAFDPVSGRFGDVVADVRPGEQADIDVRLLARPSVRVRVFASNGTTRIGAARVDVDQRYGADDRTDDDLRLRNLTADGNGELVLSGAGAPVEGEYVVMATNTAGGFSGRATGRIVAADDGKALTLDVFLFDAAGTVTGTVFRADGITPVPNAEVTVGNLAGALAFAVTDASGRYGVTSIPVGPVRVETFEAATSRTGYAEGSIDFAGREIDIPVVQYGIGLVRGTVLEGGSLVPVIGARTDLTARVPSGRAAVQLTSFTDVDGRFYFPGIPVSTFSIDVQKSFETPSGRVYANARLDEQLTREGQLIDLPVILTVRRPQFGRVEGTVFNESGGPSPFARVSLFTETSSFVRAREATADADGRYAIDQVLVGRVSVSAEPQVGGFARGTGIGELAFEGDTIRVDLVVRATSSVSGQVFQSDGVTPAAFVPLFLEGQPTSGCEAITPPACPVSDDEAAVVCQGRARRRGCYGATDGAGRFTFSNITAQTFSVTADGPITGQRAIASGTLVPPTASVRLVLSPVARVTGRALVAGAIPKSGIVADLLIAGPNGAPATHMFAATDPDGVFAFDAVPPGGLELLTLTDPLGDGVATRSVAVTASTVDLGDIVLDESAPIVTSTSPLSGATGVAFDSVVRVTFSEALARSTIVPANVVLASPTSQVSGVLSVDAGDTTVVFTPLQPLLEHTRYTLGVRNVTDRYGKVMPPFTMTFTSRDVTPPAILQLTPSAGASGVPVTTTVRVQFAEPIDPSRFSVPPVVLSRGAEVLAGRTDYAFGNTVAIFTPTFPLADATTYVIGVAAATDLSGNTGVASDVVFATTDRTPPQVTSLTAPNGGRVIEQTVIDVSAQTGAAADVAFVDFYVNGTLTATDRLAPFVFTFFATPSAGAPGSQVTVSAVATDTSGNRGVQPATAVLTVVADAAPVIAITSPVSGVSARNGERVDLVVAASDDVGLSQVAYRAETGRPQDAATVTIAPATLTRTQAFGFNMPADAAPGSVVRVTTTVRDTKGQTTSAEASITVLDAVTPTVVITGTTTGARVDPGTRVQVIVAASDLGGIARVTFNATGSATANETRTIAPAMPDVAVAFGIDVPVAAQAGQTITLVATATDASGNTATAATLVLAVADRNPPTLTLTTASGRLEAVPGADLSILAAAEDEVGVSRVSVTGSGAFAFSNARSFSPAIGSAAATFVVSVPSNAVPGSVLAVTGRAVDLFGNASDPVTIALAVRSVSDVTATPALVVAGEQAEATVTLSAPAPAGGLAVTFESRNPAIAGVVPAITIPEGAREGSVTVFGLTGGTTTIDVRIQGILRTSFSATVRGGVVRGTVRGASGAVAGAAVSIQSGLTTLSTTTDAAGQYFVEGLAVPAGQAIRVKAADAVSGQIGFAQGQFVATNGAVTLDVFLIEAGRVSGTVVRPDGTTPAGAGVKVEIFETGRSVPLALTFTDADGAFEFPLVTLGGYTLDASDTQGNRGRSTVLIDASGEEADVPIQFLGRGSIAGTVFASNGSTPVPNAQVTLHGDSVFGASVPQTRAANADGTFRFDHVFVGTATVQAVDPATDTAGSGLAIVALDGEVVTRNITLSAWTHVDGRVLRADGTTSVPGARVTLVVAGKGAFTTTTDVDGRYRFLYMPLGAFTLDAQDAAGTGSPGRVAGTLSASGGTVTHDVTLLALGSLVVTVRDGLDAPAEGATVHLSVQNGVLGQTRTLKTGADGVAVFQDVIVGAFTVSASRLSLYAQAKTGTIQAGTTTSATLQLQATGALVGTVFLPDGQTPATNVLVSTSSFIFTPQEATAVDANGAYRLPNQQVRTFPYTVYAFDQQRRLRGRSPGVVLDTAGGDARADITLVGTGTVSGQLLNPDASPAGNQLVQVRALDPVFGGFHTAVTNANGQYVIDGVVSGAFVVTAIDTARGLAAEGAGSIPAQGGNATVHMQFVSNTITTFPVSRRDANGAQYDIRADASVLPTTFNTPFSPYAGGGAFGLDLVVDGTTTRFTGATFVTSEDGGREIVARQTIGGVQVTRKVAVPRAYFGRYIESLTNTTASPVTVDVRLTSVMLGFVPGTSSSGDGVFDVSSPSAPDRWVIVRSGNADGDVFDSRSPASWATAFAFDGAGAPMRADVLTVASSTVAYGWRVTIAPGDTAAFMHFAAPQYNNAAALASAERLSQLPPEALSGLSAAEVGAIRNWAVPANAISSLEPLPAFGGTVTGRVLEHDGVTASPILTAGGFQPGNHVRFRSSLIYYGRTYETRPPTSAGVFTFANALSDGASSVAVPIAPFTLSAVHPWSQVVSPTVGGQFDAGEVVSARDVVFTNTGMLTGTVRRHGGSAVTTLGAFVIASRDQAPSFYIGNVPLAASGTFAVYGVPPFAGSLFASVPVAGTPGYTSTPLTATVAFNAVAGQSTPADIVLGPTGGMTGTVRNVAGAGVASQRVTLWQDPQFQPTFTRTALTSTGGAFAFADVPAGAYTLETTDAATGVTVRAAVTVATDQVTVQDLQFLGVSLVTGVVKRPDGTLVANVDVDLIQGPIAQPTFRRTDRADAAARFEFPNIPAGAYVLTVVDPSTGVPAQQPVTVVAGQTTTQDIVLATVGTVVVTVRANDANQTLVGGAQVYSCALPAGQSFCFPGYRGETARAGAALGQFTIADAAIGRTLVRIRHPQGYENTADATVEVVSPGAQVAATVTLQATGTVRVTVRDADGQLVAGAGVDVRYGPSYSYGAGGSTSGQVPGTFTVDGIYGAFRVTATPQGGGITASTIGTVVTEATTTDVALTLPRPVTVTGRVLGLDGQPVPFASLDFVSGADFAKYPSVSATGAYSVVLPADVPVLVSAADYNQPGRAGVREIVLPGAPATTTLDLVLDGAYLPKTLTDGNGYPFTVRRQGNVNENQFENALFNKYAFYARYPNGVQFPAFANGAAVERDGAQLLIRTRQGYQDGLFMSRRVYVPTSGYFIRYIDMLENRGTAPIDIAPMLAAWSTQGFATTSTSDGDTTVTPADQWVVSGTAAPRVSHVFAGAGAAVPVTAWRDAGNTLIYTWGEVTLQPGQRVALLHFGGQHRDQAAAEGAARRLVQLPPEAIDGITDDERSAILNFAVPSSSALASLEVTVSGVVTLDSVVPVPNAQVTLSASNPFVNAPKTVVANASGEYRITYPVVDAYTVTAFDPATNVTSPPLTGTLVPGQSSVTANISLAGVGSNTVQGTVIREGQPVVGATVRLRRGYPAVDRSVAASAGGAFVFNGVGEGTWTIEATSAFGPTPMTYFSVQGEGATIQQDVHYLTRGGTLTVDVFAADGTTRLADVEVDVYDRGTGQMIGALGGANVAAPDPQYRFGALLHSSAGLRIVAYHWTKPDVRLEVVSGFAAEGTGQSASASLVLPFGVLTGTVFDADGTTPVASASVRASQEVPSGALASSSVITDASGRFAISGLAAARVWLHAEVSGTLLTADVETTMPQAPANGAVDIVVPASGRIAGVVRSSSAAPVEGAYVALSSNGGPLDAVIYVATASDGSYAFEHVPLGAFTVQACDYSSDTTCAGATGNVATAGATVVADITFAARAAVDVLAVADASSQQPIANVPVYLYSGQMGPGDPAFAFRYADASGRAQFTDVQRGPIVAAFTDFASTSGLDVGLLGASPLSMTVPASTAATWNLTTNLTGGAWVTQPIDCAGRLRNDGEGSGGGPPFDRALRLQVNGNGIDCLSVRVGTPAAAGTTRLEYGPWLTTGLLVSRHVVHDPSASATAYLERFQNTTGASITIDVDIATRFADPLQVLTLPSAVGHRYAVVTAPGRDILGHVVAGSDSGVLVPSVVRMQVPGSHGTVRFRLTIPPNDYRVILHYVFARAAGDGAPALADALANALSTGTDASVRALLQVDSAKVVNFRLP